MLKEIVLKKFNLIPKTLIILGSGINEFVNNLTDSTNISYNELFNFKTDESIGHKGTLHLGYINKKPLLIMEGRKHYYEDVSNKDMRFMIQSFASIGVKNIIITNACGAMNESFKPGDIMVINDHINMMGLNPLVGDNNNALGPRFVDMSEPYDIEFREMIFEVAKENNILLRQGVYVSYIGPSYETKAEIRAFRMLGGDVVGMSTVPEVIIARHASMRVLGLSLITNMSTGITKNKLSHEEVLEIGKQSVNKLSKLIINFLERI
ncbi:purine-nucleoside phosphorylase [Candidatus Izemoplasma sp. B36]|uniref:purine-nucleoside phosphorylase n=1 Tax=Candidatus Izemoplasma sp. B36 TaxID=3242468 RepID=UPI0035579408